jgi:type IX secretion system PorP/SprF family membrane protein
MRKLGVLLVVLLLAGKGYAQQAPQYTQYIFNELIINPAYAGSKEIMNVNLTHRSQWVGIEGAPTTQTFSLDGSSKNGRLGYGLNAMNDALGAQRQTGVHGNLAVRLQMSETARLALGFAAGMMQHTLDGTKLNTGNQRPDLALNPQRVSELLPDFKIGAFFNTERFYTGLSVANLLNTKGDEMEVTTPNRHYFLSAGYVMDLSSTLIFKPSFLVKDDFNSPTSLDLNAFFLLGERIWLGGSYRTAVQVHSNYSDEYGLDRRNAWAAIAQLYVTPKLRLGYSYDVSLNALRQHASHEISLGYSFFKKQDTRMLTPRYF